MEGVQEMSGKKIRYDKERDAILLPMGSGSDYELGRECFKTGYAVCGTATMLNEKSWMTSAQIVDVLEIAFAVPGFLD
jgi:hypothetical protein